MRLTGKVALVTGAGSGIGAATARRFSEEGADVVLMGRRREPLELVAAEVGGAVAVGDVRSQADVDRAVALALSRYGGLDILVCNAAIARVDSADPGIDEVWDTLLDVNLLGPRRLADAAVPALRARGGGAIVNVASVVALVEWPGDGAYGASKAALLSYTRSLAMRYGPDGIRANAVLPGLVRTPMIEAELRATAEARGVSVEAAVAVATEHLPLRRFGEPTEIANACLFLASPEASFVTGAMLVADGGTTIVNAGMLGLTLARRTG